MTTPQQRASLRRSLSVWQAVGISVALMAPSMAANSNPQGTAALVGRETPPCWFTVVAFGWLLLVTIVVLVVLGLAHRMSAAFRHLDESP